MQFPWLHSFVCWIFWRYVILKSANTWWRHAILLFEKLGDKESHKTTRNGNAFLRIIADTALVLTAAGLLCNEWDGCRFDPLFLYSISWTLQGVRLITAVTSPPSVLLTLLWLIAGFNYFFQFPHDVAITPASTYPVVTTPHRCLLPSLEKLSKPHHSTQHLQ